MSRRRRFKLLVAGVGGQGVLTVARWLGEAALAVGEEVVLGQLHGMAQRGGSVVSTVLIGPGAGSFIEDGEADAVLGLEPLETLRARPKMSQRTRVVVNRGRVVPFTLAQKGLEYPDVDAVLAEIRAAVSGIVEVDGDELALLAGDRRTLNVVMLGALAGLDVLPFAGCAVWDAVEKSCPARLLDVNRRAFELGARRSAP